MENDDVLTKHRYDSRNGEYIRECFSPLRHSDCRTLTDNMENIAATFEMMVNSFTDAEELMHFAATWGIQDSPGVRFRLFQLRNPQYGDDFVNEQMERLLDSLNDTMQNREDVNLEDLDLALEYVRQQEEIEGAVRALLFDEEMDKMATACVEDGEWSPQSPGLQVGSGDEPPAGPSHRPDAPRELQYTIRKKSERTYAKKAAVDRTYQVKIDEQYNGQRLQDVRQGLHQMFEDVLEEARGNLAGNDLGRVVIHHQGLHDPIIVPLQPWDQLTADKVMEIIEKVLNSNQNLSIDESFYTSMEPIEI